MSNALMTACWPLQMPPTAKAVLVSLADNAADSGVCWPSLTTICERTCFGRSAVIQAIKWLEANGAIRADRHDRYRTTYVVTPAGFVAPQLVRQPDQSGTRTSSDDGALVRLADDEVREPNDEVRETDTNPKEPSRTLSKSNPKRAELPDWLPADAWADWVDQRKAMKKAMTPRAAELSIASLDRLRLQGHDPRAVIENAIEKGWQGLYDPTGGRGPPKPTKPNAADSFAGKRYEGTAIDELSPEIRAAVRAELDRGP
jgi:hypothetical protein